MSIRYGNIQKNMATLISLAKVGLAPLLPVVPLPLVDIVYLAHVAQQCPMRERVADHPVLHALGAQKVIDKEKVASRKEAATDRARDDLLPGVVVQVDTDRVSTGSRKGLVSDQVRYLAVGSWSNMEKKQFGLPICLPRVNDNY